MSAIPPTNEVGNEPMAFRSLFAFSCLHLGLSPTITFSNENHRPIPTATIPPRDSRRLFVQLGTLCPLCSNPALHPIPVQGILMAWNIDTRYWSFLGFCCSGELTVQKWCLGMDEHGYFRPTIWLPYPCGDVTVQEGGGLTLSAGFRQPSTNALESRVPGMLSYLNTVLFLTPRLAPGVYSSEDSSLVVGLNFFGV